MPFWHVTVARLTVPRYPGLHVRIALAPATVPSADDHVPPDTAGRAGQEPGFVNGLGGGGAVQSLVPSLVCCPKLLTLPPLVPHVPALPVWAEQDAWGGCVLSHVRHDVTPDWTMRHGSVARSHTRCTSSSACPSQQSSNPRASNSWSPAVRVTGSV
eukprot:COSAG02_NODE_369_length_23680_cov_36.650609_17_plen_157_part_00